MYFGGNGVSNHRILIDYTNGLIIDPCNSHAFPLARSVLEKMEIEGFAAPRIFVESVNEFSEKAASKKKRAWRSAIDERSKKQRLDRLEKELAY